MKRSFIDRIIMSVIGAFLITPFIFDALVPRFLRDYEIFFYEKAKLFGYGNEYLFSWGISFIMTYIVVFGAISLIKRLSKKSEK